MGIGRTDGRDDAFTDTGDDRRLAGTADQAVDIGPHGDTGLDAQLNAVLGHGTDHGGFNDFGVDAHLHGFEHVAAGQVDGAGPFEAQVDIGTVRRNEGVDDAVHIAAGQVMGFQLVDVHIEAGLVRLDQGQHDLPRYHAAQPHADEVDDAHVHAGGNGRNPQPDGYKLEKQPNQHQQHDDAETTA